MTDIGGGAAANSSDAVADRSGLQQRAMRGASWTLIHTVVSLPLAFVSNLIVARVLGVESYGRLAFLMTFMSVAGGIVALGVGVGLLQFASRAHAGGRTDDVRRLLSASQGFRLLVVAPVMSVAVFLVADVSPGLVTVAILLGIWLPAAFDGAVYCIIIEGKSDVGAKIAIVTNVLMQVAVVTVAFVVQTADAVWIVRLAVDGAMMFVYLALASKDYRAAILKPILPRNFPPGFWRFALPTGLASIIGTLALSRTEVFFLTWLSTPAAVGIFALAFGLGNHVFAPAEAVVGPLVPAVSGLHEVDRGSLVSAFERVLRASSVGIALACVAGLPALALLLPVLYGRQFEQAAPLLLALGVAGAVLAAAGPVSVFTMGRLAGRQLIVANSLALAVDVALAVALIPSLGAWGAVIANTAGAFTRFGVLLGGEARNLHLSVWRVLLMLNPAAIAMVVTVADYIVLLWMPLPPVVAGVVAPFLGLGVFIGLLKASAVGLTQADSDAVSRSVPLRLRRVLRPALWAVTARGAS